MAAQVEIEVVYPQKAARRLEGRVFSSYEAVARVLKVDQTVTVAVGTSEPYTLLGYGNITRKPIGFSFPRRLSREY